MLSEVDDLFDLSLEDVGHSVAFRHLYDTLRSYDRGGVLNVDIGVPGNARQPQPILGLQNIPGAVQISVAGDEVRLSDEVGDEAVDGPLVHNVRGSHLLYGTEVEDHDPVGHGEGFALVMGNVDDGDAEPVVEVLQLDLHLLPELEVQGAKGLVQEQNVGFIDKGPGQSNALLLTTTELAGTPLFEARQPYQFQGGLHPWLDLPLLHLSHLEREGDVLLHIHVGEEAVVLENHPQVSLVGGDVDDRVAVHENIPGCWNDKTCHHHEAGCLSRATGPQQGDELSGADLQVGAVQGANLTV